MPKRVRQTSVDAVILAGGQSRRMGRDKAALVVDGRTFIEHQVAAFSPHVNKLWVVGNNVRDMALPSNGHYLADVTAHFEGPLAGILAALQQSSADYIWLLPCDCYGLTVEHMMALQQYLLEAGSNIAYLSVADRDQPLIAVLHREILLASLLAYFSAGGRAVMPWYCSENAQALVVDNAGLACNVNTVEDYQHLLKILSAC